MTEKMVKKQAARGQPPTAVAVAGAGRPDLNAPRGASSKASVVDLLTSARSGDAACIGDLLQRYRNYLLLIANTHIEPRIQPRVSPSDVVQETMLKAHHKFAGFRGSSEKELVAWLRQILVNNLATFVEEHMLTAKRDVRREVSLQQIGATLDRSTVQFTAMLGADGPSPSVVAERREEAVVLADRLAELPTHYREVLILRNIKSMPFEEIALQMDRSLGATRMLWLRAIGKLKAIYRKEDVDVT